MPEPRISDSKSPSNILEISFLDIVTFLLEHIKFILLISFLFMLIGIGLSFSVKKQYLSQIVLLPEQGITNGSSSLSSFIAMSGSMNSERSGALRTDLYPEILSNIPFALYMLQQPVIDKDNKTYPSFKAFLNSGSSPSIFSSIFSSKKTITTSKPKSQYKDIIYLSTEEEGSAKDILRIIKSSIDRKTGIITVQATTSDPYVAAVAVKLASDYMIKYITDYRTGKSTREMNFLAQRVKEAKQRQQKAEFQLQSYRDRNRAAYLNVARIEEQRLQSEYLLAQSLYGDLVGRFEQSKIKVKEEQPIFKILEPAKVPNGKVSPKRQLYGLVFGFIGGVLATLYVFFFKGKIRSLSFKN